jgi:hypothetical protein
MRRVSVDRDGPLVEDGWRIRAYAVDGEMDFQLRCVSQKHRVKLWARIHVVRPVHNSVLGIPSYGQSKERTRHEAVGIARGCRIVAVRSQHQGAVRVLLPQRQPPSVLTA